MTNLEDALVDLWGQDDGALLLAMTASSAFGFPWRRYIGHMIGQGNLMQLCILFGTPVYLSGSYFLLLLFISWQELAAGQFQRAFLLAFAVTVSLIVHEFGHVFAAKMNGHRSQVVLVGLGALTIPSGESKGWRGVRLSLAGPVAGLLLAMIVYFGFGPAKDLPFWDYVLGRVYFDDGTLWPYLQRVLVFIGIFWSLFNLIPILPMDGGHALRDFLTVFTRAYKANAIAAKVSILFAIPLALWFMQIGLIFAAVLVGYFAWQNYEALRQNQ